MAALADPSSGIVYVFVFVFMIVFSLGQSLQARAGALEHELVLCAIMSKLKLSEKYNDCFGEPRQLLKKQHISESRLSQNYLLAGNLKEGIF